MQCAPDTRMKSKVSTINYRIRELVRWNSYDLSPVFEGGGGGNSLIKGRIDTYHSSSLHLPIYSLPVCLWGRECGHHIHLDIEVS